jgi:DnaJ-class molecular chaperone
MIFKHGIQFVRTLKPAENFEICPICKGTGQTESLVSVADFIEDDCELCKGNGQIDWITYMRYKGNGFKRTS